MDDQDRQEGDSQIPDNLKVVDVQEERKEKTQSQEEDGIVDDLNDEELITVRDICRVARSDIPSQKQKDRILDLVCFSMGRTLSRKKYKDLLSKHNKNKGTNAQLVEIIKNSEFR